MEIRTEAVSASLGGVKIIKSLNLSAGKGEFIGVIGPNGSGKSTLLKCIYRVLRPDAGAVYIEGKSISKLSIKESAKRLAVLAQHAAVSFDFTVLELVLMGRTPHKQALSRDNAEDYRIARESLATVGLAGFEKRIYTTLSGGERQRVMLAQALTQQTPCLILDEPTNHLDIKYQLQTMDIVKGLGCTVVAAVHDLNIAAMYCDRIYVLCDGEIVDEGSPADVLQPELIRRVYGVDARIIDDGTGQVVIAYMRM